MAAMDVPMIVGDCRIDARHNIRFGVSTDTGDAVFWLFDKAGKDTSGAITTKADVVEDGRGTFIVLSRATYTVMATIRVNVETRAVVVKLLSSDGELNTLDGTCRLGVR